MVPLALFLLAIAGMSKPVLVIGAGLAGLCLARSLLGKSVPVRIFDSLPQLRRHSYGVTLLPWAYEPVVRTLKLGDGIGLRRATATDFKVGGLGHINPSGASGHLASGKREEDRQSYRCSRSKLSEVLSQGVDVEFNRKLKSIQSSSTGVTVHFEDGETAEGILAVGADGVHSAGQSIRSLSFEPLQHLYIYSHLHSASVVLFCSASVHPTRSKTFNHPSLGHQWQRKPVTG